MDIIPMAIGGLAFPIMIMFAVISASDDKKECSTCGFSKESHSDKDKQWHPDNNPCNNFTRK